MYRPGDRVKLKHKDGSKERAIIQNVSGHYTYINQYGLTSEITVKTQSKKIKTVYEYELTIDLDCTNAPCECGSDSAYQNRPNEIAGHAYFCPKQQWNF